MLTSGSQTDERKQDSTTVLECMERIDTCSILSRIIAELTKKGIDMPVRDIYYECVTQFNPPLAVGFLISGISRTQGFLLYISVSDMVERLNSCRKCQLAESK